MHPRPTGLRWRLTAGAAAAVLAATPAAAYASTTPAGHKDDHGHHHDHGNHHRHGRHHQRDEFLRTDLVSDQPGHAQLTDPNLVNAWGMSRGPNTPVWVSDNGKDVATLYQGAVGKTPVSAVPLVVSIPGGAPTGQVFNDTSSFVVPGSGQPAHFVFAGEHGDLSAWNSGTSAVRVAHSHHPAVYKGLALVHGRFGPRLLAADFHNNRVDVFNGAFHRVHSHKLFSDRSLPRGYAPFNIAVIGQDVLVTYAQQDAARMDDVAGPGHGFIDEYTQDGRLVRRFASGGDLNSPWGMTLAPPGFGKIAGELLVGNFGDGHIHIFDPRSGHELGSLLGRHHKPIVIDGLWGLLTGDAVAGGPDAVWFSAGPQDEAHGLLGTLTSDRHRHDQHGPHHGPVMHK